MFRARLIFPIWDEQERVVGFGGRAMGDEQPKYLNTGDTPLFNKSKILYALPYARRKIAAERKALLMEGYMDVIAAHQAGFTNAVAGMGTSLTEENARRLARLVPEDPKVVLVYDADKAGIKATLTASELLEKEGAQVLVARLPAGEDPDSLLRAGGVDRFQRTIDDAVGRVEYQLERIVAKADETTDAGRALKLRQIVAILASVPTRSERDVYVEKVWRHHPSSAHGAPSAKEQLHRDAEAYLRSKGRPRKAADPAQPAAPEKPVGAAVEELSRREQRFNESGGTRKNGFRKDWRDRPHAIEPPPQAMAPITKEERAERQIMRALAEPDWASTVLRCIPEEDLPSEEGRRFYRFVRDHDVSSEGGAAELARMLMVEEEESFSSVILGRLQESNALLANEPITDLALKECVAVLRKHRIKALREELERFVQDKNVLTPEDQDRVDEIHKTLWQLKSPQTGS
jgi:DNA primase